jgi:hypothetical protein
MTGASPKKSIVLLRKEIMNKLVVDLLLEPFKELGLDSQRVKKLTTKLHVHSVNYAAKLVHTRRALSSTVVNSHQETVSGRACSPPGPQTKKKEERKEKLRRQ